MSSDTQRPLTNGTISHRSQTQSEMDELNEQLRRSKYLAKFHGDALIGVREESFLGLEHAHAV